MRFKKRLLSEEIGLDKTNKKTFTKGKTQKIVVSEGQLQRLMVSLDEANEGLRPDWFEPIKNPCPDGPPCGGTGMIAGGPGDSCGEDIGHGVETFCQAHLECSEGGVCVGPHANDSRVSDGGGDHVCCPASYDSNGNWVDCCDKTGSSRREMGEGTQPCVQDQSCAKRHYWDENKCKCVAGHPPARRAPKDISKTKASNNDSNSGSGILPQCCYRPDGTIMYQHCNNCPTRPGFYCANCPPPVSESLIKNNLKEMRKLRTTQPINESQVDKMSGWFNRLNNAGSHYNPVNLLEQPNGNGSNSEGHGVDDEEQDCKRCLPNGKIEKKTFDFSIECPEGWVDVSEEICCPSVCCEDPNQGGNIVSANPAMGCRCSKSQTEVPCSSSSASLGSSDRMVSEIKYTYNLIRKAIIKENIKGLQLKDYRGSILTEAQDEWRGRNPGVSAAAGIENIIDGMKRAWSAIKDSTTRKQIQNTLVKLNNFMMYSAELVGSGSSQRAPRSYEQLADPLPFPELDEPEDLEDIDDEISF